MDVLTWLFFEPFPAHAALAGTTCARAFCELTWRAALYSKKNLASVDVLPQEEACGGETNKPELAARQPVEPGDDPSVVLHEGEQILHPVALAVEVPVGRMLIAAGAAPANVRTTGTANARKRVRHRHIRTHAPRLTALARRGGGHVKAAYID